MGWHYRGGDASLSEGPCTVPVVTEGEAEIVQMGGSGGFATMIEYSSRSSTSLGLECSIVIFNNITRNSRDIGHYPRWRRISNNPSADSRREHCKIVASKSDA